MTKTVNLGLRVDAADLAAIDERARQLGISRTRFLLDKALDRTETQSFGTQAQVDEHEQRLVTLERELQRLGELAYGG